MTLTRNTLRLKPTTLTRGRAGEEVVYSEVVDGPGACVMDFGKRCGREAARTALLALKRKHRRVWIAEPHYYSDLVDDLIRAGVVEREPYRLAAAEPVALERGRTHGGPIKPTLGSVARDADDFVDRTYRAALLGTLKPYFPAASPEELSAAAARIGMALLWSAAQKNEKRGNLTGSREKIHRLRGALDELLAAIEEVEGDKYASRWMGKAVAGAETSKRALLQSLRLARRKTFVATGLAGAETQELNPPAVPDLHRLCEVIGEEWQRWAGRDARGNARPFTATSKGGLRPIDLVGEVLAIGDLTPRPEALVRAVRDVAKRLAKD
ncbi:MAG: hypothetical protein FJX20_17260 [Alphaproteobacteria bacterium]|nr:hypothetical protein [Alphaproteobacteria bacterium]